MKLTIQQIKNKHTYKIHNKPIIKKISTHKEIKNKINVI